MAGWNVQAPINATANVSTSSVYYVAGQKAAATAVAATLHLPPSAVLPYTTAAPVSTIGTAEVLVVVAPDLAGSHDVDDDRLGHLSHASVPGGPGPSGLPRGAAALLAPLLVDPTATALITDFDGTLSPIVVDPAAARPLDGVPDLLDRLARRFGVVAVVSGRPAGFLVEHLTAGPVAGASRVHLVGLYGMEEAGPDGSVRLADGRHPWLPVVAEVADPARGRRPGGVLVEVKGAAVTVHWRRVPEAEAWVAGQVAEAAARTGLVRHPGRASVELRPPLGIDKGTVVRDLTIERPPQGRLHRHRSGPDRHADAAQEGRRRQVCRVLRFGTEQHQLGGSGDRREHGTRVRCDHGLLPSRRGKRSTTCATQAATNRWFNLSRRTPRRMACSVRTIRQIRCSLTPLNWIFPQSRRPWQVRNVRRTRLN